MSFEDVLAAWLVRQRWFAGKGRTVHDLAVVADTEIIPGDPGLRHLLVTVSHGATSDCYQLFIGQRARLPARLRHARIGSDAGLQIYDGLHDSDLTRTLLDAIVDGRTIGGLRFCRIPAADFSWATDPDGADRTGLDSLVLTGEQSNTSLVFGEAAIFKVFRRVAPGPNPDLEVAAALAELGSTHIAEPYGWVETRIDGATTVLAILSRYLRAASDGWSLAATSVRDLYADAETVTAGIAAAGIATADIATADIATADIAAAGLAAEAGGDFAGEAERLGVATAQVHADLAAAFGTSELEPDAVRELAEQMFRRLDLAIAAVPDLTAYADKIGDAFSRLAKLNEPVAAQRVHGDYHLGQVMRTQAGWVVLDFEGEPASPLAQRRARSSPLRDVAGMLRSFDYAARHQLLTHPDRSRLAPVASDWVRRNSEAFCAGYAAAGGLDPWQNSVLLRALLLDKAVYEVIYEARNRPNWLIIPLESIAEMP
jgi:maltokinase